MLIDKNSPSWPSPRSWEISNTLLKAGLDVDPAIGKPCATEFRSFCKVYKNLPNIEPILNGKSQPNFPKDLSALLHLSNKFGTINNVLQSTKDTNDDIRMNRDWEQMKGRAVV